MFYITHLESFSDASQHDKGSWGLISKTDGLAWSLLDLKILTIQSDMATVHSLHSLMGENVYFWAY